MDIYVIVEMCLDYPDEIVVAYTTEEKANNHIKEFEAWKKKCPGDAWGIYQRIKKIPMVQDG